MAKDDVARRLLGYSSAARALISTAKEWAADREHPMAQVIGEQILDQLRVWEADNAPLNNPANRTAVEEALFAYLDYDLSEDVAQMAAEYVGELRREAGVA